MNNYTSNTITILLSKRGKHAGKYETLVSIEDADLAGFNWQFQLDRDTGYARRTVGVNNRETIYIHRVIMSRILERKLLKTECVDHIDGNGLNNKRDNLRVATKSQNAMNSKARRNNTTGFRGVVCVKRKLKKRFMATITHNNAIYRLGYFETAEEANEAYCEAANELHGEFANEG